MVEVGRAGTPGDLARVLGPARRDARQARLDHRFPDGGLAASGALIALRADQVVGLLLEQPVRRVLDRLAGQRSGSHSGSPRPVPRLARAWLSSCMLLASTTRIVP